MILEQGTVATKQETITFVHELLTKAQDENDQEFYARIIDCIVKAVCVYDNHYIVWFYFDGGNIKMPTQLEIDEYTKSAESSAPIAVGGE